MPEQETNILERLEFMRYQSDIAKAVHAIDLRKLIEVYQQREAQYRDSVVYALAIIAAGKLSVRAFHLKLFVLSLEAANWAKRIHEASDKLPRPLNDADFLGKKLNLLPDLAYIAMLSLRGDYAAAAIEYDLLRQYRDYEIHLLVIFAAGNQGNFTLARQAHKTLSKFNLVTIDADNALKKAYSRYQFFFRQATPRSQEKNTVLAQP
jgi:hypothetical protein